MTAKNSRRQFLHSSSAVLFGAAAATLQTSQAQNAKRIGIDSNATGEEYWRYNTGSGIFASPAVYSIDGEEFITVASGGGSRGRRGGDLILTFALPKRN